MKNFIIKALVLSGLFASFVHAETNTTFGTTSGGYANAELNSTNTIVGQSFTTVTGARITNITYDANSSGGVTGAVTVGLYSDSNCSDSSAKINDFSVSLTADATTRSINTSAQSFVTTGTANILCFTYEATDMNFSTSSASTYNDGTAYYGSPLAAIDAKDLNMTISFNSPPTGSVTIDDSNTTVGANILADISGLTDADGTSTFNYQWVENNSSGDFNISGQTDDNLTLIDAYAGNKIKVIVTYDDNDSQAETMSSSLSGTTVLTVADAAVAAANVAAGGTPTISGFPIIGHTLTAITTDVNDSNGLPDASTFSYQWENNESTVLSTSSSYVVLSTDINKTIRVSVSFTDTAGTDENVTSSFSAMVLAAVTSDSVPAVNVDGNVTVGDGNGDGILDSTQPYVASETYTVNGRAEWTTAAIKDGNSTITATVAHTTDTNGLLPLSTLSAPAGKFAVNVSGIAAGATAEITLFIPYQGSVDSLYKLIGSGGTDEGTYEKITAAITHFPSDRKTRIVYSVTDGSKFDADGNATNGIIIDPVIPAGINTNAPISPKAYMLLILLILGLGIYKTRQVVKSA